MLILSRRVGDAQAVVVARGQLAQRELFFHLWPRAMHDHDLDAECVQQGPTPCSHALPFGYCFLCNHPRLDEIIENTKRAHQAVKI